MSYYDDDDDPFIEFRITEPLYQEPFWFGNEITVEDGFGDLRSYTKEEWHEILLNDADSLEYFFNLSHYDVIYELERAGAWDQEDWEDWRDAYASIHGV